MWGRISNVAAQLDARLGDNEEEDNGSQTQSSFVEEDGSAALGEDDGWGDDMDGFDDDLDFDDHDDDGNEEEEELLVENGGGAAAEKPLEEEVQVQNDSLSPVDNGNVDVIPKETEEDVAATIEEDYMKDEPASESEEISPKVDDENETQPEPDVAQAAVAMALPQSPPPPQQTIDQPSIITVSAPGKALIAGGYLVLESPNPGVVLAAKGCRFHTTVTFKPPYSPPPTTSSSGATRVIVIGNSVDASWESIPLDVYSPQFDRVFSYYLSYSMDDDGSDEEDCLIRLQPRTGPHVPNKFIERSLLLTLGYLRKSMGPDEFHHRLQNYAECITNNGEQRVALAMKLRADNDFYSQITRLQERGLELTPQNVDGLEPFLPCPKDETTGELIVNKTGMGSSAALVTSIVGALLCFFGVVALPTQKEEEEDDGDDDVVDNAPTVPAVNGNSVDGGEQAKDGLRVAHNLAQICHCHAQGKVGSGFDVSSAIYGSHVYTRFTRGLIIDFLSSVDAGTTTKTTSKAAEEDGGLQLSDPLSKQLVTLVNDIKWDCTVSPICLPPGLELLMADVCGGSESPSMARKIQKWKKNNRKVGFMDDYYWKDLKRVNKKIASLLSDKFTSQTFLDGLRRDGAMIISSRTAEQWKKPMPSSWHEFEGSSWDVALKLVDLRMAFLESRQNLKGMGKAAGVPVEPDEQSKIANATMKLPGVVAAGVPGAGGYDALFVIYVKGPETHDGSSDLVRDEIVNLWNEMTEEDDTTKVCPLSVRAAGSDGLCSTKKLEW